MPASLLVGRLGDDTAILPRATYMWDTSGWAASTPFDEVRWYVFDDRGMYRPGEEVHVKGFVREIGYGPEGDVSMAGLAGAPVTYQVMDPQGNQLTQGEVELSNLGGFSLAFTLPVQSNLGYASIQFTTPTTGNTYNNSYYHSFQVQEFRRPEFAVTANNETTGPYYLGDTATVAASAQYYAGGPLPGARDGLDGQRVADRLPAAELGRVCLWRVDAVVVSPAAAAACGRTWSTATSGTTRGRRGRGRSR